MRLPEVGEFVRHHGTLVEIQTVPPPPQPPPEQDYIFESVEARCELRLSGESLQELKTLTDYCGVETSVESAVQEMQEYAAKKKIGLASDLEVVVVRVVRRFRARPVARENLYDKSFQDFEPLARGASGGLPEPVETVVWSSKGDSTGR